LAEASSYSELSDDARARFDLEVEESETAWLASGSAESDVAELMGLYPERRLRLVESPLEYFSESDQDAGLGDGEL
jgi:hypothetical protein